MFIRVRESQKQCKVFAKDIMMRDANNFMEKMEDT